MKITLTVLGLLVVLGVLYGLAFLGVIPVQKWAAKNPAMAKALAKMHLAPAKSKKPATLAAASGAPKPDPARQALQAQEQQIAADRDQLNKDRAAFEADKQQAGSAPAAPATADTGAKLSAILATMSPDDIAKIFAKLPDPVVIQNLLPLDEKKAGQVLAALPADRAARLSQLMLASAAPQRTAANPPRPSHRQAYPSRPGILPVEG